MLNIKQRRFENKEYLSFIRRMPCCVSGVLPVDAHHTATKGMGSIVNDYYAVPLAHDIHFQGVSHITEAKLGELVGEPLRELVVFYNSLFIEFNAGRYDLDADECCGFYQYRKMLEGGRA